MKGTLRLVVIGLSLVSVVLLAFPHRRGIVSRSADVSLLTCNGADYLLVSDLSHGHFLSDDEFTVEIDKAGVATVDRRFRLFGVVNIFMPGRNNDLAVVVPKSTIKSVKLRMRSGEVVSVLPQRLSCIVIDERGLPMSNR